MTVAIVGGGRTFLDDFAEALVRLANAVSMTLEEFLAALKAAEEAALEQASPRSPISRLGFQEYKRQGPSHKTRYGRLWSSW